MEDFVEALKTIKPSSKADDPSLTNGKSLYQLEDSKVRRNLQIYPTQPGDVEIGHRRPPLQLGYTNGKSLYQLEDSKAKFNPNFNSTQSENVDIRHRRPPPQLEYTNEKSFDPSEDAKLKRNLHIYLKQLGNVEIGHRRPPPRLGYASATTDTQRSSPSKHFIPGNKRPESLPYKPLKSQNDQCEN